MAARFRHALASHTLRTLRSVVATNLRSAIEARSDASVARQISLKPPKSVKVPGATCSSSVENGRVCFQLPRDPDLFQNEETVTRFINSFPLDTHNSCDEKTTCPELSSLTAAIDGVSLNSSEDCFQFHIDTKVFLDQTLKSTAFKSIRLNDELVRQIVNPHNEANPETVVVEFSSPNIAKAFHVGHFRSAIVGNFVANIHAAVGQNNVIRLNYLGDWGTQFGHLLNGLDNRGVCLADLKKQLSDASVEDPKKHQLEFLLQVYIEANKLAGPDRAIESRARELFSRLEADTDPELTGIWQHCRAISIDQLKKAYTRLNISFDEYHGESMYRAGDTTAVLERLESAGMLELDASGRKVVPLTKDKKVTVVKSDGSSLYISRDIAAAIHRYQTFKFDKMFYVVDNSQASHFSNLFEILGRLNCGWSDNCHHVKFGKILGLSTRSGNIIFMDHLLDEAKQRMLEKQEAASTTRVVKGSKEADYTAEVLGISALVINDLKQRRSKDYKFSWDNALNSSGDTGVRLQYSHARLYNLEAGCGVELTADCDTASLADSPAAIELTLCLGLWEEVLSRSFEDLEPAYIVQYLFSLVNATNRCVKNLKVKGSNSEESRARLLLFHSARLVMAQGMEILGLVPLNQM